MPYTTKNCDLKDSHAFCDEISSFGNKTNLSNTPNVDSINAGISAAGNNAYVSWWERNTTSISQSLE